MSLGSKLFQKPTAFKPHLVKNRPDGVAGEVAKLRADILAELNPLAAIGIEEWTNPPAAANNLIKTGIATSTTAQRYSGAALDGAVGGAAFVAPRRVCVLQAAGAHYTAANVTIKGFDAQGKALTDTLLLLATGTGNIVATTKFFARVVEILVPAQADLLGTLTFGIGLATGGADDGDIGLARAPKVRTGSLLILQELVDGSVVTTGTLTAASTDGPYGSYTPAAAPNGAHDYCIKYEYDPTV